MYDLFVIFIKHAENDYDSIKANAKAWWKIDGEPLILWSSTKTRLPP